MEEQYSAVHTGSVVVGNKVAVHCLFNAHCTCQRGKKYEFTVASTQIGFIVVGNKVAVCSLSQT